MGWVAYTAMVLAMIYAAAIALAVRDRYFPRPPFVPKAPKLTSRRMLVPLVLLSPAIIGGIAVALIVLLPIFIWRTLADWFPQRDGK